MDTLHPQLFSALEDPLSKTAPERDQTAVMSITACQSKRPLKARKVAYVEPKDLVAAMKAQPDHKKLVLVDCRDSEKDAQPADPKAQHIKGAVHFEVSDSSSAKLDEIFDRNMVDNSEFFKYAPSADAVVFYCSWGSNRSPGMCVFWNHWLEKDHKDTKQQVCYLRGGMSGLEKVPAAQEFLTAWSGYAAWYAKQKGKA